MNLAKAIFSLDKNFNFIKKLIEQKILSNPVFIMLNIIDYAFFLSPSPVKMVITNLKCIAFFFCLNSSEKLKQHNDQLSGLYLR